MVIKCHRQSSNTGNQEALPTPFRCSSVCDSLSCVEHTCAITLYNTPMETSNFSLHPTLAADTHTIAQLPLCMLLLSNDSNYPWTILVPRQNNISEIFQLDTADQQQLLTESSALSQCLQTVLSPDKLNIAALGNMVPQLHLHHIARYKSDKAWPAPVWGHSTPTPYNSKDRDTLTTDIYNWLLAQTSLLDKSS